MTDEERKALAETMFHVLELRSPVSGSDRKLLELLAAIDPDGQRGKAARAQLNHWDRKNG